MAARLQLSQNQIVASHGVCAAIKHAFDPKAGAMSDFVRSVSPEDETQSREER